MARVAVVSFPSARETKGRHAEKYKHLDVKDRKGEVRANRSASPALQSSLTRLGRKRLYAG